MKYAFMILILAVLTGCSQTSGSGNSDAPETSSQIEISESHAHQSQADNRQRYAQPTDNVAYNDTFKIKLVKGSLTGKWKHNIVYSVGY